MDILSAIKTLTASAGSLPGAEVGQGAMTQAITPQDLQKIATDLSPGSATAAAPVSGSFQNVLGNLVGEVNAQQGAADTAVSGLLAGKNVSLHQVMISMEEASVSFQMMVEVRNKLLDSYQELMRMQV